MESFLSAPICLEAGLQLRDGACIALNINDNVYYYLRSKKTNRLLLRKNTEPDLQFSLSEDTARRFISMFEKQNVQLGAVAIAFFEAIASRDPEKQIKWRVNTSIFTLWRKGYFSLLKAAGPEVVSYFKHFGINSLAQLKTILEKMRG